MLQQIWNWIVVIWNYPVLPPLLTPAEAVALIIITLLIGFLALRRIVR